MLIAEQIAIKLDQQTVIKSLDCEFRPGQFWAILGRNGTGKTTLLHALSGLIPVDDGQISVNGHAVRQLDPLSRAQNLSLLLQEQEPSLAISVEDAVAMGRYPWQTTVAQDRDLTRRMLRLCGLEPLAKRSILQLSGGERRKVEIATCLAQQAGYLLLDEPLNHLDLVYKKHIMKVFSEYARERTVVMVCHDTEVVRAHCTHVLMILENDCYLSGNSATMLTEQNLNRLFNDRHQHD